MKLLAFVLGFALAWNFILTFRLIRLKDEMDFQWSVCKETFKDFRKKQEELVDLMEKGKELTNARIMAQSATLKSKIHTEHMIEIKLIKQISEKVQKLLEKEV